MAYGVSAWFDSKSERRIRRIWKDLHEMNINSTLHSGPYRPHITFGIFGTLDVEAFSTALIRRTRTIGSLPFVLPSIGIFTDSSPAGFLNVTMTERLLSLHTLIHALMSEFGSDPVRYYLPGRWNPHCTLAPDLMKSRLPAFTQQMASLKLPFNGVIDRIGIIDTPAEIELKDIPLCP